MKTLYKLIALAAAALLCLPHASLLAQELISLPGNWTLTRTYTNAAGTSSFEDITFYDGLGYAEQVVQVGASPSGGKNIVTPVWYDAMRRDDARSYLPYVSTNSSRTEESTSSVLTNQSTWYNNNGWSGQGDYAFAEQEYEASPLNRILKVRKPGSTYAKAVSGSKAIQMTYATNTASEVRKLSVNSSGQLILSGGYYGTGTLHKLTNTDEDGSVSVVWTDVLGRTVLSRQTSGSTNMDTYYVYDDAGHLCWVVTPEGSALLGSSGTWALSDATTDVNTSNAARFCYIYTWDGHGRQLSRKIPGKAVEYFVYDRAGRQVMSQDGLLRAAGLWGTCKYDNAGRLVRRALLSSTQTRSSLQAVFDSGVSVNITPLLTGGTTLDSFDYGTYGNVPSTLAFSAVSGVTPTVDQTRIKGLKTYEKVAVLSGTGVPTTYVQRAFYYDALGRLIQTVESNAMGTVSRISSAYDFLGNVTASREQHGNDYKTTAFTYDTRGRLLSETTGVNGSVTASMAYTYDPLGRLKTTTSGSGTNAVTTTDSFNIQGWLTARSAMKGSSNIFSMSLGYYTPVLSGATARYSGDISSWTWTHSGSTVNRAYAFTYDGAHRLSDGQFYSNGTSTNALSEKGISYDRAGNITALSRYNNSGAATSLAYSYTGNRRNNYSYDVNGNVTSDATNSLQSSYNLINLPSQIKSGSTVKANYSYLSDGTKAAALNASSVGYDYAGSFTYSHASNGAKTLESVAFGGGRIRKSGSTYAVDYHITDHLGSVRAIVNASGTVVEQNDYYPFGMRHPNGLTQLSANRWRFSGKEEQDAAFGIAYSDFGARFYDRSAAWTTIDPMAEKYFSVSPYAFCNNNPVKLADTDGQVVHIAIGAAIGAAVNGGIAAIQGKSPQEIKAAAAGGAVAGAITAATGGASLIVAIAGGAVAGAAGSFTEQALGPDKVNLNILLEDTIAGAAGSVLGKGGNSIINKISGKVSSQIERKYASESVKTAIQNEIKKEYKAAGKVFGPATKKNMKKAVSDRIETLAGAEKVINNMVEKVAKETQQSFVGEGAKYSVHYMFENNEYE